MTQKLTLPIQLGKKYVRRDGKVVTANESHENKTDYVVYIGEQDVAEYDRSGELHAWKSSGRINGENYALHQHDIIADYIESATAHPHAEAMMEYAKDAAMMAEPWKNWEFYHPLLGWRNLGANPEWDIKHGYRRKQPKVVINGIECVAGVKEAVFDELYYVASLTRSEYYFTLRYTGAHKGYVERGIVHLTREDAIAMAKAMLNFQ